MRIHIDGKEILLENSIDKKADIFGSQDMLKMRNSETLSRL